MISLPSVSFLSLNCQKKKYHLSTKNLNKMTTIPTAVTTQKEIPANAKAIKIVPLTVLKKRWIDNDIILNMGFRESLIRGIIVLFLPWALLAINHNLILYAAPVMSYLLFTALIHFCFIKWAWQHWVLKMKTPEVCDFSKELDVPVDHI
jgi:hypothetical protein